MPLAIASKAAEGIGSAILTECSSPSSLIKQLANPMTK
jgi:hypothetical protein